MARRAPRGQRSSAHRIGTAALDRQIRRALLQLRGEAKCTAAYLRKHIPGAADVSLETLRRRLREVGLAWLRRRRKTLVSAGDKKSRLGWARWTLRSRRATLDRWVYGDGTVFYLDRTRSEHDSTRRAALGPHVWRMTDGSDALYTDCVGPSSYYKGQGAPVRVWGLLVGPRLYITILPAGQVMNRWWYAWVVRRFFGAWLADRDRRLLVQDYERCLWCDEPLEAMKEIRLSPVEQHPKRSPDLNAIENARALPRGRVGATGPEGLESREDFCKRLHVCVKWVNRNRAPSLLEFATNLLERKEGPEEKEPPFEDLPGGVRREGTRNAGEGGTGEEGTRDSLGLVGNESHRFCLKTIRNHPRDSWDSFYFKRLESNSNLLK